MFEKQKKVTEQELADARRDLAYAILESENAQEILMSLNQLTRTYAKRASHKKRRGKKAEAKAWKLLADECYTITMCAVYTKQDQISE